MNPLRPIIFALMVWTSLTAATALSAQSNAIADQAAAGDAAAQFVLARQYHTGDGVVQDYALAAEWARRAAEQGHADAQNLLGQFYAAGRGVAQDNDQAVIWLQRAAAQGNGAHLYDLGRLLDDPAPKEAARAYEAALAAGQTEAAVNLGVLYQTGRGVAQDYARAFDLFTQSATAGHARGQNNLGLLYVRGHGVEQDYERAATLFAAAADQGLKQALRNLGVLYENGLGVPLDEARATELYRQAGQTTTKSQPSIEIGALIYDPRLAPLPEMDAQTLSALQQTANAGDPVAQFQLGWVTLQNETSSPQNTQTAARLFTAAAKAGHAPAMANLGVLYFQGRGVPQDYVLGQMWLIRARVSGLAEVRAVAQTYADIPTAAQITEAQEMAKEIAASP